MTKNTFTVPRRVVPAPSVLAPPPHSFHKEDRKRGNGDTVCWHGRPRENSVIESLPFQKLSLGSKKRKKKKKRAHVLRHHQPQFAISSKHAPSTERHHPSLDSRTFQSPRLAGQERRALTPRVPRSRAPPRGMPRAQIAHAVMPPRSQN